MKSLKPCLSVFILVVLLVPFCTPAFALEYGPRWYLLVQEMTEPNGEAVDGALEFHRWVDEDEYRTKWRTRLFDGQHSYTIPKLVIVSQSRPCYVDVRKIKLTKVIAKRPADENTISFEVDQMYLLPLSGKGKRRIAGANPLAAAREIMASDCSDAAESWFNSSFQYIINPLSFYKDCISYELRTNEPGGAHPLHDAHWRTVRVGTKRCVKLDSKIFDKQVRFNVMKQYEDTGEDSTYFSPDFNSFALLPDDRVQFAFNHAVEVARGSLQVFSTPYKKRANYPSIKSPDGSVEVTLKDEQLFWKSRNSKTSKAIGSITNMRGWQWLDVSKLGRAERKKLLW